MFHTQEQQHPGTDNCSYPQVVPFLLESKLREHGALFETAADLWAPHAVADHKLVTGESAIRERRQGWDPGRWGATPCAP